MAVGHWPLNFYQLRGTATSRRTQFVIIAGLPGSGKTALAEALLQRIGGVVLSKDIARAAMFEPEEIDYSDRQNDYVMSLVLQHAQRIARDGSQPFVFLDGRTFSRAAQVEPVVRAAAEVGAELRVLYLHCPDSLALQRISGGRGNHLAANRDAELYLRIKASFEPIALPKLDVDTSQPLEDCVEKCVGYLTSRGPERG
jgi:predicted kinase